MISSATAAPISVFLGQRYGLPPTGDLRFAPAVQAPGPGYIVPGHKGPRCLQTPRKDDMSEDCLFLNVYTPTAAYKGTAPLVPIMVWIHGGGWTAGSGNSYDGSSLAARENIMVVPINYRLGTLGWYASEELVLEPSSNGSTGGMNGLLDQITALRWLHANAHRFGGDASAITIAGESAGAESVCLLLVSPIAKGLFSRAIIESGPCIGGKLGWGPHPRNEALRASAKAVQNRTLKELRAVEDAYTLLQGAGVADVGGRIAAGIDGHWAASAVLANVSSDDSHDKIEDSVDGYVLPGRMAGPADKSPVFELLQRGEVNAEAVLLGSNSYDGLQSYYVIEEVNPLTDRIPESVYEYNLRGVFGPDTAAVQALYPPSRFPSGTNGADVSPVGDGGVLCPTLEMAGLLAAQHVPAYAYQFSYGPRCGDVMRSTRYTGGAGWASHASEIAWAFGSSASCFTNASELNLTHTMQALWGSFVRADEGAPRAGALTWEPYELGRGNTLLLDLSPRMVDGLKADDCQRLLAINQTFWPHAETLGSTAASTPDSRTLPRPQVSLWPQTWAGAGNSLFPAPVDGSHADWLKGLREWRQSTRAAAGLSGGGEVYTVEALRWTQTSYVQPQVHSFDRMLWNETSGSYTVDRYLDDCVRRYGGIDSVLLWPTYPNIGIDERNQFDLLRLSGLDVAIADFHARGVRVLLPYNPWDEATRRESAPDHEVLAELSAQVQADGFNGDTVKRVGREFWEAGIKAGRPLAIEPEAGGYPDGNTSEFDEQWNATGWSSMGWAYHWVGTSADDNETTVYLPAPGVDRAKWLEPLGRHMTHVTDRWRKQRGTALQLAFFNANGYESWENVWGAWNGVTERDGEALRRVATLLRFFGTHNFTRNFAASEAGWVPHTPEAVGESIYASRFEQAAEGGGQRLWLLVNGGRHNASGPVLRLESGRRRPGVVAGVEGASCLYVDAYHGVLLQPTLGADSSIELAFDLEAEGFGAVVELCGVTEPPPAIASLMKTMRPMSRIPLGQLDATWRPLQQVMEPVPSTPLPPDGASPPPEMVAVPRTRQWRFEVAGVEIEGGCDPSHDQQGVCCQGDCSRWAGDDSLINCQCGMEAADDAGDDVQFPWESSPRRHHAAVLDIGPFWIDTTPVTREAYQRFMQVSGYRPVDARGFLPLLVGVPAGSGSLPVTGVSHEEAAAYCEAHGKRLPTTHEWQYAAQGNTTRRYPWGDTLDPSRFPKVEHPNGAKNLSWSGPAAVDAFAASGGQSPFGMQDVVGNVWQWTSSEFVDAHTRSIIVRGSSSYVPFTDPYEPLSDPMKFSWYFPPALPLDRHNRWLAQKGNLAYSRAATVGFRCVKDVVGGAPAPWHYHAAVPVRA